MKMEAKIPHSQVNSTFQAVEMVAPITLKTKIKRFFFLYFAMTFLKEAKNQVFTEKGYFIYTQLDKVIYIFFTRTN